MDLRVDMHIFTEICEAFRRSEPIILHGYDAKGSTRKIEISESATKSFKLVSDVARTAVVPAQLAQQS